MNVEIVTPKVPLASNAVRATVAPGVDTVVAREDVPAKESGVTAAYVQAITSACEEIATNLEQDGVDCSKFRIIFFRPTDGTSKMHIPMITTTYSFRAEEPLPFQAIIPQSEYAPRLQPSSEDIVRYICDAIRKSIRRD